MEIYYREHYSFMSGMLTFYSSVCCIKKTTEKWIYEDIYCTLFAMEHLFETQVSTILSVNMYSMMVSYKKYSYGYSAVW